MFYSYIVLLIYINEMIYLLGNLPFFKIHVNHFIAHGDSPCANVISEYMWVRGLVPLWVSRHSLSLINNFLIVHNILLKASGGALFLPLSDVYVRSFLYLFYTLIKLYHTELSSLFTGLRLNSSPLEAKNPSIFHDSATTFQAYSHFMGGKSEDRDEWHALVEWCWVMYLEVKP